MMLNAVKPAFSISQLLLSELFDATGIVNLKIGSILAISDLGLQRYVDTDRVPNDGVSGPSHFLNDLTAALANLLKALVEVIDGQT